MKRDQLVIALVKASEIVEFLVSAGETDLGTIARDLRLPKSTVRRLLLTLISIRYVEQNPQNSNYRISRMFVELGLRVMEHYDFVHVSRPFMLGLAEKTGETVNLGVLDGLEIVCLDQVSSKHSLRQDQPLGSRVLSYCTSFGKSILAYLSEDELDHLFRDRPLQTLTTKSLRTYEDLKRELKLIRTRGYAVDDEEAVAGVRCVGAAIFNHHAKPVAGLSLAGPAIRITKNRIKELGPLLKNTAKAISERLGG